MGDILAEQLSSPGAPILFTLIALSIAAATATFFKVFEFSRLGVGKQHEADALLERFRGGDEKALESIRSPDTARGRVVRAALAALGGTRGSADSAERAGIETAAGELSRMARHLRLLEAVVQAAPMLGLLGTVIGMIDAFARLSEASGAVDPALLAGGIWVALTTTALGLIIAVPFYFVSVWLDGRIEEERTAMEVLVSRAISARNVSRSPRPAYG